MTKKLVALEDGVLVQIQGPDREMAPMGMGAVRGPERSGAVAVDQGFEQVEALVKRSCQSFSAAMRDFQRDMFAGTAKVEFGVAMNAKGQPYVVCDQGQANFRISLGWNFEAKDS